jgi:DNA polymerase-3 subunit gamma/tau
MRDALSALDQLISFKGDALTEDDVLAVFGLVSRRSLENLATAVLSGDMPQILKLVDMFDSAGKDMRRLTVELMEHFRNLLVYQYVGQNMSSLDATPEQLRTLATQASLADAARVQQIADQLAEMEGRLRFALSVRTLIEMTLIRCARISRAVSLEEVLRRLNTIRAAEPPAAAPAPAAAAKAPSASILDDPLLKAVLKEFDGKIVGVEDGDD